MTSYGNCVIITFLSFFQSNSPNVKTINLPSSLEMIRTTYSFSESIQTLKGIFRHEKTGFYPQKMHFIAVCQNTAKEDCAVCGLVLRQIVRKTCTKLEFAFSKDISHTSLSL